MDDRLILVTGATGYAGGRLVPRLLVAGCRALRAATKVPGPAWLGFEARPEGEGVRLVQTAYLAPRGLACWYGMYAAHGRIFSGMMHALAAASIGRRPPVAAGGGADAGSTVERRQGA